jgi:rhamnulokinase
MRYACVLQEIGDLTGTPVKGIHIVGGGSQNRYLNQLTADVSGLKVLAGPVEATALGNVLVQAIADGRFKDLAQAREFVRTNIPLKLFEPRISHDTEKRLSMFRKICG